MRNICNYNSFKPSQQFMHQQTKVRNIERIQKALESLQSLTVEEIAILSSQESLSQLRIKRIQNLKSCLQGVSADSERIFPAEENQAIKNKKTRGWQTLTTMPIIASKQIRKSYEQDFNNKINEYRNRIQEQEEKQFINSGLGKPVREDPPVSKKQGGFAPTSFHQTGLFSLNNQTSSTINKIQQTPQTPQLPLFENASISQKQTTFTTATVVPNQGFTLNLNNNSKSKESSLFQRKLEVPEISQPEPLKLNSGLFSSSNPLSNLKIQKNNFFNPPKPVVELSFNQQQLPKNINIYAKVLSLPQSLPEKPFEVKTGGLFSSSNPWTEKTIDISQSNNINLFQNNIFVNAQNMNNGSQASEITPHPEVQQSKAIEIVGPNIFNQLIHFADKPNIFNQMKPVEAVPSIFQQTKPQVSIFGTIQPNLFSSQNKPNFQTTIAQQPPIKPAEPTFFAKPTKNIFSQTPVAKLNMFQSLNSYKQPQPAQFPAYDTKPNIISDLGSTGGIFGKTDKHADDKLKNDKPKIAIEPEKTKLNNLDSNPKSSFFVLKPIQMEQPKQKSTFEPAPTKNDDGGDDSSKKSGKKANQLFNNFLKSKPENMFNKDQKSNIFVSNVPDGLSIFGNISQPISGLFTNTQNSLFGNNNAATGPIFSKPPAQEGDQQQEDVEDDVDVIEDKQVIDRTKSTGNYKYEEYQVKFKDTASKFKRGELSIVENVIVSIQKHSESENQILGVRFTNKCPYLLGTILKGVTEAVSIKEKQFRNLAIKKILCTNDGKTSLQMLKIQFKEDKSGQNFLQAFQKASKK